MHAADIVAALKKCGTNLSRLGLDHGFAESTLRAALHKPHPRAQALIATTIGKSLHEIWPHWFTPAGARIAPTRSGPARRKNPTSRVTASSAAASRSTETAA